MALEAVPAPDVLRTDKVVAQEIRDKLAPLLESLCRAYDEARAEGLTINVSIEPDMYGRFVVKQLLIVKPL